MEYVRIAILSTYDKVCAFLDNKAKKALHYYDDELVEYLKGTASTLTLTATARHPDSQYLVEGNKLAFKYRDRDYYMNIMHVERDEYEVTVEAYSLSFELLNEQRGAYSAAEAMSFTEYMSVFDPEHTVTLGINEVADKSITHSWEGEDTILARIFSLATVFSAEVEFLPELNDNYSLKRIVMNVYKEHSDTAQGVGQRRSDLTLRYGKDISGITKISDITELYTAITPVGRDGLTVASLDKTEYDADGNVEYRSPLNSTHIYAVQARDRFPSNLMANENERYIGVNWEYDTDNVNTLYGQALAQLKKNCVPKISYEVDGYFDTNIGDTVTIADESFNPVLYLEARVTEQHRSFTDPTQNKTTFDNFKELQSEIDSSLLARVEELIAQGKTYTAMISTNNGIVFKNGVGETTMTAHVRDSVGEELAENFVIHWYKDGSEVYIGNPYTISADDVDGKAVYRFEALDATGIVKAFYEVTVSDVNDGEDGQPGEPGEDGKTSYFHVRYSPNSDGNPMSTTPDEYIGTYVDFVEADSNDPADYTWSKFQGHDGAQGIPGVNGENGETSYLHIAYANSADGSVDFSITESDGKSYIGQYVDFEINDSENPADYNWTKIKGEDGMSLYTWIKYADTPTTGMSDSPDGKQYMGIAYNKTTPEESTRYEDYTWSRITGEGIPGAPGEDGKTLYTWVRYADDAQGTGISDDPTGKNYIGLAYNKETPTESNDPEDYTWSLFRGPQGVPGNPGEKGEQGTPGENGRSYVIESSVPEIKVSGDGFTPNRVTFNMYFYDGSGNRQDLDVYAVADQFIDGEWVQSWTWTTKSNIKTIFTSVIDQAAEFVRLTVYNTRSDGIFSDKLAEYTLPITFNTFSAPGTYTSDTAPTQPFAGMLWKNTGTAGGYIQNAIYQWNGSEWTLYYFAAANLDVKKLSAISGDMGELTAGSIEIPWEYTDNPQFTIQGTTKFSKSEGGTNPISVEFKLINKGTQEVDATGSAVYDYNGVTISINYTTGESRRMRLGYGSLSFSDNENTATFGLSEILKLKSGAEEWTALPLNTNYVASEGNTPMYRKVPIYGSTSWKVELKGQVARSDGENVHGTVGTLPEGYRPSDSVIYMQADDTFMGARVAVVNTGAVQSRTVYNSKYVSLDGISFEVEE